MPRKPHDFADHPASFGAAMRAGFTRAVCYHVVDGDTADFMLDLGWYHYAYHALRFEGIDTAETRGTRGQERALALAAKHRVESLLLGQPVLLQAHKQQATFGRFVARIWFRLDDAGLAEKLPGAVRLGPAGPPWTSINELLVHEGLARRSR